MGDINLKAALGGQIVLTPTNTASNYTATFPAVTGVVSVQASASYTTGSVLFVNSSGQIAQNNSQFFWDNTNYRLGIGTATPGVSLVVGASSVSTNNGGTLVQFNAASRALTNTPGIVSIGSTSAAAADAGGSLSFSAETGAGVTPYVLGSISCRLTATGAYGGYLAFATTEAGGSTYERMRIDKDGNVNIATTGVSAKLYVNGNAAQNISALGSSTGTVTLDLSTANNFSMTLTGNVTLANPSNITAGQSGVIFITNGSSSAYTMSFGTYWDFPNQSAPSLTATTNAVDVLVWTARTTTSIAVQILPNIGP